MSIVDLDQDYHVHSLFSNDAHSSPEENLAEAEWMGLRTLCLVDHVRSSSTHVPDLVAMVRALRPRSGIEILCGVEAKLLDRSGALDLPPHAGVDHVMIADHQFPSEQGPVTAAEVRERLARGLLRADGVVECLVDASIAAMSAVERPVLAHPFSFFSRVGISEALVADTQIRRLAAAARDSGALIEVNEKWSCPSARLIAALHGAGATLVAGSGAHHCSEVGFYLNITRSLSSLHDLDSPVAATV